MEKKKKIQKGIIIASLAALFLLCVYIETAEKKYGSCGENLTWAYRRGVLTISGTGDMSYEGRAPWHKWCLDGIEKVVIKEGCTSIGEYAFQGSNCLTEVVLPDSLQCIGKGAFRNCKALTEIDFTDSLQWIDERAYADCSTLVQITLPD